MHTSPIPTRPPCHADFKHLKQKPHSQRQLPLAIDHVHGPVGQHLDIGEQLNQPTRHSADIASPAQIQDAVEAMQAHVLDARLNPQLKLATLLAAIDADAAVA